MSTPANPHADRAGLVRLAGGSWIVLERVQASKADVPTIHAAKEGEDRTLCGKTVTFRYGLHPTDTPSMILCTSCRDRIARWL